MANFSRNSCKKNMKLLIGCLFSLKITVLCSKFSNFDAKKLAQKRLRNSAISLQEHETKFLHYLIEIMNASFSMKIAKPDKLLIILNKKASKLIELKYKTLLLTE